MVESTSYYALRRTVGPTAEAWWAVARRRPDIPEAVTALAAGRTRVELGHDEAVEALAWAERVDCWPASGPAPLYLHPCDPRG